MPSIAGLKALATKKPSAKYAREQLGITLMSIVHAEHLAASCLVASLTAELNCYCTEGHGNVDTLIRMAPAVPSSFSKVPLDLLEINLNEESYQIFTRFYERLQGAILSLRFLGEQANSSETFPVSLLEEVAATWQETCSSAMCAIYEGQSYIVASAPIDDLPDFGQDQYTLMILAAARDGVSPLPSAFPLTNNDWAERRQAPREKVDVEATLEHNNTRSPIRITDASISGLGMSTAVDLEKSDTIAIDLAEGARVTGSVKWSNGEKAGMAFDRPIKQIRKLLLGTRKKHKK